jgi:hypothetical protein
VAQSLSKALKGDQLIVSVDGISLDKLLRLKGKKLKVVKLNLDSLISPWD